MVNLGSKKQVLVVGNDGVMLYTLKGKTVSLYRDFSDSGGSLTSDIKAAFKAVNLPLVLLFDVAEQQYRREAIPPVSFLDKSKVIKRKLAMAFPQQLFRASYVAKPKKGSEKEAVVALFAGLSATLTIMQVMDAILGSEVYIEGAALLPLESINMFVKLVDQTRKNNKSRGNARWSVLMTHHKSGGLRQIVIKDGELALTRMTPLIVDIDRPDALSDEMVREFNSTLTYLSRFGYVPADGIDLYVVSTPNVAQYLQNHHLPVTDLYTLTLLQACELVGLKLGYAERAMPDYGEILHAGWVGMQSSLVVSLSSAVLDRVKQARQSARFLIFAMLIGIAYFGWQLAPLQTSINTLGNDLHTQETQKRKLQVDLEDLKKRLDTLKYDPDKTKLLLDTYDDNNKKSMDVLPTLKALMPLFDHKKVLLKLISIEQGTGSGSSSPAVAPPPPPAGTVVDPTKKVVDIKMEVSFPEEVSVVDAARNTLELADKMRTRFPGREVDVTEMIGDLAMDKTVQGTSAQLARGVVGGRDARSNASKIEIKGALE